MIRTFKGFSLSQMMKFFANFLLSKQDLKKYGLYKSRLKNTPNLSQFEFDCQKDNISIQNYEYYYSLN